MPRRRTGFGAKKTGVNALMGAKKTGVNALMGAKRTGVNALMGAKKTGVNALMGAKKTGVVPALLLMSNRAGRSHARRNLFASGAPRGWIKRAADRRRLRDRGRSLSLCLRRRVGV